MSLSWQFKELPILFLEEWEKVGATEDLDGEKIKCSGVKKT